MPFVSTDPASWTEDNLDDQNRPTLQAVIDGLGLVLDKDDTRRGRYKGKSRFVKADLIRGLLDHKIAVGQAYTVDTVGERAANSVLIGSVFRGVR